jgi:hypothetical protein
MTQNSNVMISITNNGNPFIKKLILVYENCCNFDVLFSIMVEKCSCP